MLYAPIDMTLQEALCAPGSDVLIYDTFNAAAACAASEAGSFLLIGGNDAPAVAALPAPMPEVVPVAATPAREAEGENSRLPQPGSRKRRRRERSVKNREDAESQRMTHIAVERNRRRQMNEYLAVLRSLMPDSYVHRGDQASIVSGAIDCVKELEQQLQSLEAQKRALLAVQKQQRNNNNNMVSAERHTARSTTQTPMSSSPDAAAGENDDEEEEAAPASPPPPFAQFFRYPQYVWLHARPREDGGVGCGADGASRVSGVADVEVSVVVDAHASVRVMAPRRPGQLLKMVAGLQALGLAVLHLNVTKAGALVFYTLSLKVEEGCALTAADEIAAAVHHVLCIIEAEATAQQPGLS